MSRRLVKRAIDEMSFIGLRRAALGYSDYTGWCFGDYCRRHHHARRNWSEHRKVGKLNRKRLRRQALSAIVRG